MNTRQSLTIALAFAAFASAGAASAAPTSQEEWFGSEPAVQGTPLSRAEVAADLALWNRAGLGHSMEGERNAVSDPTYATRLAEYRRLRSGPEYVAEVRRQGGTVSAVAGQPSAAGGN